jgi:ABC-type glycerol-3-phosphate transport system permease component
MGIMKKKTSWSKLVLIVILLIWTIFPIYWMISLSVRNSDELRSAIPLLPQSFTFDHFLRLFKEKDMGNALSNSLQVTFISLFFALLFGLASAYVLSRKRLQVKISKPTLFWILLIRILPPIAFAIPLYLIMTRLGLIRTKIPIISAHIMINLAFIVWFMITFYLSLPQEIEDSARIDGATELQLFSRIVLPLVAPGIASVAILSFMTSWNEYLYGVIFVQSPKNYTIPLVLATLNSEQELAEYGLIAAGGVISLLPIMLFVIFAQNYLISGLSSGAVKE